MAKIEIIGPKSHFFDVVTMLHENGRLHIEDLTKKISEGELPLDRMEVDETHRVDREKMDEQLIRVRSILKALDKGGKVEPSKEEVARYYDELAGLDTEELGKRIDAVISEVEDRTAALAGTHADLESELSRLARYEPILQKIQPLARQIVAAKNYESTALLLERRYKAAIEELKKELDKLTHSQYEIGTTDVDEETTAAIIVFDRRYSDAVHRFLSMENINQIRLPSEFADMPFDAAYDEIRARRSSLPHDLDKVRENLEEVSTRWRAKLEAVRNQLIDRTAEVDAVSKFGRTTYAFVITGWMPVKDVDVLRDTMSKRWGDEIILTTSEVREDEFDEAPVAMDNPERVAPFQNIVGLMGTPRYGTIDPTFLVFFFYPLFFGMMVGDIGYGLVMLGIVIWLRSKFADNPSIQTATSVLGPAATMVIAFGIIYGEFFGDLLGPHYLNLIRPIEIFGVSLPFTRVADDNIMVFMLIALAVGVVHVLLGLIIGVINAVRTGNKGHLYEKAGILAFLVGALLAAAMAMPEITGAFGNWSKAGQVIFALVALAGFMLAIRGGKVMGAIELVESVAHIVSYIRIMAAGLMGAIFADAVNSIVVGMGNPVGGAIFGVLLHSLNFIIAAFSPTIHAIRLNFIEFFGNFFEIGKQQYRPFVKTGGE